MELSKKSWHFQLHQLLYGRDANIPNNLCPYFWKTIIPGILFIVPLTVLVIPMYLIEIVLRRFEIDTLPRIKDEGYFSFFFFVMCLVDAVLFVIYCMIAMWFTTFTNDSVSIVQGIGVIGYIALFICTIVYFNSLWEEKKRERLRKKHDKLRSQGIDPYRSTPKQPNVFIEFIKAWYKKNCPIITWKE